MNVKIGQIFRRSWGYDQTNVDYFQVVALKAKTAVVREINSKQVPGTGGFMSCQVTPDRDNFKDSELPRVVKFRDEGSTGRPLIVVGPKKYAFLVQSDTEQTYCSWYA